MTRPSLLVLLCVLAVGGCAVRYAGYPPVPAPPEELVPAPPRSSVVLSWRPGHYDWTGTQYVWERGRWIDRAGHGTLWQDGFWRREGGQYVWVPGHWL